MDGSATYNSCGAAVPGELMVALNVERRVVLLRVKPRVTPADCEKTTSLDEFITILEHQVAANAARCYLTPAGVLIADDDTETPRDDKNQIYIAQIRRDSSRNILTLLVNRGNPNAVAPALLKPTSNNVTYIEPNEGQTPGSSAHLVISTTWAGGYHSGAYEKMPGVPTSLTQAALNRIVERWTEAKAEYRYQYVTGKGSKQRTVTAPYRPILIFDRMPSEKLLDDLEKGELTGVTLTKRVTEYAGPGQQDIIKYQEQKLVIHARHKDKSSMESFAANVAAYGKEQGYDTLQLHVARLPFNQTSNPTISLTDEEEALETLYARAQVISGFSVLLEGLYENICSDIEAKIYGLL